MNDVWPLSDNRLIVVGDNGLILESTLNGLNKRNRGVESPIVALLNLEEEGVAAITENGDIAVGRRCGWRIIENEDIAEFSAFSAASSKSDDIVIGGVRFSEPNILRFDGQAFESNEVIIADEQTASPCQSIKRLLSIGDELFAVCDNGNVIRRDDGIWRPVGQETSCAIRDDYYGWGVDQISIPAIDHRVQDPNGDGRCLHAFFDGDTCRACALL
ncbi:MAG: hypothetical protein JXA30_06445, partial [Deltaproteobacteria bacterium]|nr:hypothetical protein [Deltaproteobacteria bacterium]